MWKGGWLTEVTRSPIDTVCWARVMIAMAVYLLMRFRERTLTGCGVKGVWFVRSWRGHWGRESTNLGVAPESRVLKENSSSSLVLRRASCLQQLYVLSENMR